MAVLLLEVLGIFFWICLFIYSPSCFFLQSGQSHLFENWDPMGLNDEEKHFFFEQVKSLHSSYPVDGGGI